MSDLPKICTLCIALMLFAGRASSQSAANGKAATTDPKASTSEKPHALDESIRAKIKTMKPNQDWCAISMPFNRLPSVVLLTKEGPTQSNLVKASQTQSNQIQPYPSRMKARPSKSDHIRPNPTNFCQPASWLATVKKSEIKCHLFNFI